MEYFIAIIVVWIIGVIVVVGGRNHPALGKLEPHEKMRVTGLTFIGFSIVSSIPAIALILLAIQLGFN